VGVATGRSGAVRDRTQGVLAALRVRGSDDSGRCYRMIEREVRALLRTHAGPAATLQGRDDVAGSYDELSMGMSGDLELAIRVRRDNRTCGPGDLRPAAYARRLLVAHVAARA
jgi:hypothetical protein